MIKKKKITSLLLIFVMAFMVFSACQSQQVPDSDSTNQESSSESDSSKDVAKEEKADQIYFLNFKPEIAEIYDKIAADYEEETGVKVKVVTAASGTYEQTLKSEIAKSDPPTIFQVNGPIGYQTWKEYCLDLKDTKLYSFLTDPSLAITSGDGVYGIPYVVEGYGIIYNNAIVEKYFALTDRGTEFNSMNEINNFDKLKALVEDMQAHKDELGIEGVFASTSLSPGEAWRWETHLANMPFYYEFKDKEGYDDSILAGLASEEIEFKYNQNYKKIFDLYINNSCTEKAMLGGKSVNDSMAEFALGKVAMVQNGNWAWAQIKGVEGNVVDEKDIKFLPIYIGVEEDESQGICVGTENYFAINSKVSEAKQKASIEFLEWLFSSEKGKDYVVNELGFIAPFNTFEEDEKPEDPLAREVLNWMEKDGMKSVPWVFAVFPSQNFKNTFADALLEYVQDNIQWEEVVERVIESWKVEKAKGE